jgi:hypothetical protein
MSYNKIANVLYSEGFVSSKGGNFFDKSQIGRILRRYNFYKGKYLKDGEYVQGEHPPILDEYIGENFDIESLKLKMIHGVKCKVA